MSRLAVYYASDIHGSELLWRKFLNAGPFYRAQVLIMGGDLCGKGVVPIVSRQDGTSESSFPDGRVILRSEADVERLESEIRSAGMYPFRCTPAELGVLAASPERQDEVLEQLMATTWEHWLRIADTKLAESKLPCYAMPGNDDRFVIDDAFESSQHVHNCDQQVIEIGDGYSLLSFGYANPTPWDSPRELSEHDLESKLEELAAQVHDKRRAIFNLHVPPYDSRLDTAPSLDSELRPKVVAGHVVTAPAGSTAVRAIIERHQPLLALHGHIHESKGAAWIGKTLCINPGSNYTSGRLDGVLVRLENAAIKNFQFVTG